LQIKETKNRSNKRNRLDGVNYDRLVEASAFMPTIHGHGQRERLIRDLDQLSQCALYPEPRKGRDMLNIAPIINKTSGFIDRSTGRLTLPLKDDEKKLLVSELKNIVLVLLPISTAQTHWLARVLNNLNVLDKQTINHLCSGYLHCHRRNIEKLGVMWVQLIDMDSRFHQSTVFITIIEIFLSKCMLAHASPKPLKTFSIHLIAIAERQAEVRRVLLSYNMFFNDTGFHVVAQSNDEPHAVINVLQPHHDSLYQFFLERSQA